MLRNNDEPETQNSNYDVFDYRLIDDSSNSQLASQPATLLTSGHNNIFVHYVLAATTAAATVIANKVADISPLMSAEAWLLYIYIYSVCNLYTAYITHMRYIYARMHPRNTCILWHRQAIYTHSHVTKHIF